MNLESIQKRILNGEVIDLDTDSDNVFCEIWFSKGRYCLTLNGRFYSTRLLFWLIKKDLKSIEKKYNTNIKL